MERFINDIKNENFYNHQIVHVENLGEKKAKYGELKSPLNNSLKNVIDDISHNLYSHQAEAINSIREGKNVVIETSTASGKTLCYNIPIIEKCLENNKATALCIYPLNALVNDQIKGFVRLINKIESDWKVKATKCIGGMGRGVISCIRDEGINVVFTNPEMLHYRVLPQHIIWETFFEHLKFIVIDEVHIYRGVFGSNFANFIRRLRRICTLYGSSPQFICCSATIANAKDHIEKLIGLDFELINNDGSIKSQRKFVFWNPPTYINDEGFRLRKGCHRETTRLMGKSIDWGMNTIAFTRRRVNTERMLLWTQKALTNHAEYLRDKVFAYRAGYLAEEREEIERKLKQGEIMGLFTTNALELGIDIGSLDSCIIDGFPGSIMSTWQQAGRVARGEDEGFVALIASNDPLNQYYMKHPEAFFEKNVENAVLDNENEYILTGHLLCACKEFPISEGDRKIFGNSLKKFLEELGNENILIKDGDGFGTWFYNGKEKPHNRVSLRGIDDRYFKIIDKNTGKLIETIDEARVQKEAHPNAIFLHQGISYFIDELDFNEKKVLSTPTTKTYLTDPISEKDLIILEIYDEKEFSVGNKRLKTKVSFGEVKVTERVIGYVEKDMDDTIIGTYSLDLPPIYLPTTALWVEIPLDIIDLVENEFGRDFDGSIHAIEHTAIAMFPVNILCDRNDVGGLSYPIKPELGKPAIFIYDGYKGGIGLAEKGYTTLEELLFVTLKAIESCSCYEGCPSCIQSPKCGNNNKPLDKEGAVIILRELLGIERYNPSIKSKQQRMGRKRSRRRKGDFPQTKKRKSYTPVDVEKAMKNVIKKMRKKRFQPSNNEKIE